MFRTLILQRKTIINLAVNDFKRKYAGSYLGVFWAFAQPIITVLVYWFVFQVGFRTTSVGNTPFILWLATGLTPWFFYSDAVSNAMFSFLDYSYLVKKVVFQISILPVVKIVSSLLIHIVFILFIVVLYMAYGYPLSLYALQVVYYVFCTVALVTSLSYMLSSIVVFFRDLNQIIGIILQFTMWLTPIVWDIKIIPTSFIFILKLNPLFYIVQGFRDAFIERVWFWQHGLMSVYFWLLVLAMFGLSVVCFKRLKPHFADAL